jgi:chaperonin cofactor prefoldin
MSDFEKEHPLMNEVTRTINELYVHKKHDKVLQDLLKREGLTKKRLQVANKKGV